MTHYDLPVFIALVQNLYPPEARTARNLLMLVSATRGAILRARPLINAHENKTLRTQLLLTLEGLDDRLDEYTKVVATLQPGDEMPEELAPLLHRRAPLRQFTPEFAAPLVVEEALDLDDDPNNDTAFIDELQETLGLGDDEPDAGDGDDDEPDDDDDEPDDDDDGPNLLLWGAGSVVLVGGIFALSR